MFSAHRVSHVFAFTYDFLCPSCSRPHRVLCTSCARNVPPPPPPPAGTVVHLTQPAVLGLDGLGAPTGGSTWEAVMVVGGVLVFAVVRDRKGAAPLLFC